jgi:hypothetical protein
LRIVLVLVLSFAVLPLAALSSATVPIAAHPATLVEGHTVHATLGAAAAVAPNGLPVKGTPITQPIFASTESTFPGVRWFNDQYVVDPLANSGEPRRDFSAGAAVLVSDASGRTPCTGALFVVDHGAADPRGSLTQESYLESYIVTDPNDRTWNVDRWASPIDGGSVYTVAINDNQDGYNVPDDGTSNCAPVRDGVIAHGQGDNGLTYPGRETLVPGGIQYNTYVFAFTSDLHVAGALVAHQSGGAGRAAGALAGNSHAFDPLPGLLRSPASSHGGSDGAAGTHATRQVDLYYGATDAPLVRQFRLVDSTEGSLAPFGGDPR